MNKEPQLNLKVGDHVWELTMYPHQLYKHTVTDFREHEKGLLFLTESESFSKDGEFVSQIDRGYKLSPFFSNFNTAKEIGELLLFQRIVSSMLAMNEAVTYYHQLRISKEEDYNPTLD